MKTAFIILIFLFSAFILSASIINIPDDYSTIQEGIDASVDSDTVLVQPATYVENIDYNGKLITVTSLFLTTQDTTYISQTIIDGNNYGRVVIFAGNEDSTAVLAGFTITNGYTAEENGGGIYCYQSNPSIIHNYIIGNEGYDGGGGIYCDNSSPHLESLTISGNSSKAGGGICCVDNSNPRLVDVTITGNYTSGDVVSVGGGICCWDNSCPNLVNVFISDNSAAYGGGICCSDSSPNLENVTIENNTAEYNGGGIYCGWYSNPSLMNVTIIGNSAVYGGGIDCYESSPILQDVTISDNSADEDGGGIYCSNSSPILDNVSICCNSAEEDGGGIHCESSSPSLDNVTITNNLVTGNISGGGGIYCEDSSLSLENTTISDNSVTGNDGGGGIYCSNSIMSLENVEIIGNWAEYEPGGGILCSNSYMSLENVEIMINLAGDGGGICCLNNSNLSLVNVTISGNSAGCSGGGIGCFNNSNTSLINVTISDNFAEEAGGGIFSYNWITTENQICMTNVMICGNQSDIAGAFQCAVIAPAVLDQITITNSTICDNESDNEGAISLSGYINNVNIINSIIRNNTEEEIFLGVENINLYIDFTNITGGWEGTDNIDEDPMFSGTGEDPYSLLEDSPCIDTGIPDVSCLDLPPYDIIGNERIWDGNGDGTAIIDMGAYEFGAPPYVEIDDNIIIQTPGVHLYQNYPNPFNPTTTISFQLSAFSNQEDVELEIYNIKGQKIKTLTHSLTHQPTNCYKVSWDGTDDYNQPVSSGIYLYKLQAGKQVQTRKMILLK